MKKVDTLGEWSESIQAFWFGANDCEWIAWKGSHQIFVYPCHSHPNPPTQVIQHTKRIETLEDFTEAIETGKLLDASYTRKSNPASGIVENYSKFPKRQLEMEKQLIKKAIR